MFSSLLNVNQSFKKYQKQAVCLLTLPFWSLFTTPIECIRSRMQVNVPQQMGSLLIRQYNNPMDCFKKITKNQGFTRLWSGSRQNLAKLYSTEFLTFICKDELQTFFKNTLNNNQGNQFVSNYLGGAFSGLFVRTLVYPLELAKNITTQSKKHQQNLQHKRSIPSKLLEMYKKDGIRGLYIGCTISLIGVTLFRSTYFSLFDTFKQKTYDFYDRWLLSYLSVFAAISITYPLDTIRRRFKQKNENGVRKYSNYLKCVNSIFMKQGIRGLYQGSSIIVVQSAAVANIYFVMDMILKKQQVEK